ncbi:Unknown protein, partial [Striga hermonthica]
RRFLCCGDLLNIQLLLGRPAYCHFLDVLPDCFKQKGLRLGDKRLFQSLTERLVVFYCDSNLSILVGVLVGNIKGTSTVDKTIEFRRENINLRKCIQLSYFFVSFLCFENYIFRIVNQVVDKITSNSDLKSVETMTMDLDVELNFYQFLFHEKLPTLSLIEREQEKDGY